LTSYHWKQVVAMGFLGISLALSVTLVLVLKPSVAQDDVWTYMCKEEPEKIGGHQVQGRCIKVLSSKISDGVDTKDLDGCKLTCGDHGMLWPIPTGNVTMAKTLVKNLVPESVTFSKESVFPNPKIDDMLNELEKIFKNYLRANHPDFDPASKTILEGGFTESGAGVPSLDVRFTIRSSEVSPVMEQDEGYRLVLNSPPDNPSLMVANVEAQTYFGARHAVETLSQLIAYDESNNALQIVSSADIIDKPEYTHRGLILDTSRNYFSMRILRKVVDGLSYNKMNVFHWHITDSHSFPLELPNSIPELAQYGAYSKHKTYSPEQVKELVEYARVRGVKVLPEFDAPAHVGNGWQYAEEKHPEWGRLAVCVNKEPWQDFCVEPPCGQFNVLNEKLYEVLGEMFREWLGMFDSDVFHMGGDEVNFDCWMSEPEFIDYMKKHNKNGTKEDYLDLWRDFQDKAFTKVSEAAGKTLPAIIWTNSMTEEGVEKFLHVDDYIIQLWTKLDDPDVTDIISKGYRTIFSPWDRFYLDCGYSAWVGDSGKNWCSPYKGWQLIYGTSPRKSYLSLPDAKPDLAKNILGGEVAMWSEQVSGLAVEGKLWPRGSALGERLWADPDTDWKAAEQRFLAQRWRFLARGIAADAHQPEWCFQNEDLCY